MSNNQLDTTTQDKKEQNLQLIANSPDFRVIS